MPKAKTLNADQTALAKAKKLMEPEQLEFELLHTYRPSTDDKENEAIKSRGGDGKD